MDYFKLHLLLESMPADQQQVPAQNGGEMVKPMLPQEDDPAIVVRSAAQAYKSALDTLKQDLQTTIIDAANKLAQKGSYTAGTLAHKDLPPEHRGTPHAVTGTSAGKLTPMGGEGGDEKVASMVSAFEKWKQRRAQQQQAGGGV